MRVFYLLMTMCIFSSCKSQNGPSANKEESLNESQNKNVKEVRYQRQARSGSSLLVFGPKQLTISYANKKTQTYTYPQQEWDSIVYFASKIDLAEMPGLKAPTQQRTYDGAAAAQLTIVVEQKAWSSSTFDDGYPPDDISELVHKLLSLEEDFLKNR